MKAPVNVSFDYETRIAVGGNFIIKAGAYEYARHPSTEIFSLAFKRHGHKTKTWWPLEGEAVPQEFIDYLSDPKVILFAHNAFFERVITKFVLSKYITVSDIPVSRWRCNAAQAAACAMPRKLEKLALALDLKKKKDMTGHRLMLKYSQPRPQWAKTGKGPVFFSDQSEIERVYSYNIDDVEVEYLAGLTLPRLPPNEQKIWEVNQEMNLRGITIDIKTVGKILAMVKAEQIDLNQELENICGVDSFNKRDAILKWLGGRGVEIDDLKAPTVEAAVKELSGPEKRVLEIRQSGAKASVKKYQAMKMRTGADGRARDLVLYHGASTGRETARGIQVHNFPRGDKKLNQDLAIEMINAHDRDFLKVCYGDLFKLFSNVTRGMVTASPGNVLAVADWNAIEARIGDWMSGNTPGLDAWASGADLYKELAAKIFQKPIEEIDDDERFVGKTTRLGCLYGMGAGKLYVQTTSMGASKMDQRIADKAVKVFRRDNAAIPAMWANLEDAAIRVVRNKTKVIEVNKVTFLYEDNFLKIKLPSGRCLFYYKPAVKTETDKWDRVKPVVYFHQMNKKNQWVMDKVWGGVWTENVVQATARDLNFHAILNAVAKGYLYNMQIHDEIISEKKKVDIEDYKRVLLALPAWATGLPVKIGGWQNFRYGKG